MMTDVPLVVPLIKLTKFVELPRFYEYSVFARQICDYLRILRMRLYFTTNLFVLVHDGNRKQVAKLVPIKIDKIMLPLVGYVDESSAVIFSIHLLTCLTGEFGSR
ncbi:hypothetical protein ONS96_000120 [Cadophora gregata f. sp. sojae]|nr:hypothetical protein ONS96_000120 [Cadophora gregata f. sp. sojae]